MTRRNNPHLRCLRCRLHKDLCACALIPRIETRTRVLICMHRDEAKKPTNTGRLASECLVNSRVFVRGVDAADSEPFALERIGNAVLLFPDAEAPLLSDLVLSDEPVTLIVPDGTWRQASKMRRRVFGLQDIPCVALPPGEPSMYRLRRESQQAGLATIEAIARALGILEGPAVERALDLVFRTVVERTLWTRGAIKSAHVTGGIPEGARAG